MYNPLISVCIPVFNGQKHLEICLNSIIIQTYSNLEILIIDDCSSDLSLRIIQKFASIDHRVKFIVNPNNLGLVKNWNKCIDLARGVWIKLMFQDDIMQPDCIAKMFQCCITNDVEFALCARDFIIEESTNSHLKTFFQEEVYKLESHFQIPTILNSNELLTIVEAKLLTNFLGEPIVTFFKKSILLKIGNFKVHFPQLVDYEFMLRAILNTPVYFIPEHLVTFRVHGMSESNNQVVTIEKRIRIELIEPFLFIHEYLFDKRLARVKSTVGVFYLLRVVARIYRNKAAFYPASLINEAFNPLYRDYKHLSMLVLFAKSFLLYKRIQTKYFA